MAGIRALFGGFGFILTKESPEMRQSKLTDEQMIRETAVDGHHRTYETTEAGDKLYDNEVARLRRCLRDADAVRGEEKPPC